MGELIVAVKAELVKSFNIPEGVSRYSPQMMTSMLQIMGENLIVEDRDKLEKNPKYKQIIPYVVIESFANYYSAVRTKEGGDSRLHHKRIIGFGGHANPIPSAYDFEMALMMNAERELTEELVLEDTVEKEFVGFINDNSNAVGQDHLGVLVIASIKNKLVYINETSVLTDAKFMTKNELIGVRDTLENWSSLALNILG